MFWKRSSFKPKPTSSLAGRTGLKVFILQSKKLSHRGARKGESRPSFRQLGRSSTGVFLLWTKWACSRDRKDKWGKSWGHLPSVFQPGSSNTVQRPLQPHRCRQGWHFECTENLINWDKRSSINSPLRLGASREASLGFANLWSRLAINKTQAPGPEVLICAS